MKRTYTTIALVIGVTLLLAVAGLSFWAFSQIKDAASARKHTFETIILTESLISELKNAELFQREYLARTNEASLNQFNASLDTLSRHLATLKLKSTLNPAHQPLNALVSSITTKTTELSRGLDFQRNQADMHSHLLLDSILAEKNTFIGIEEAALSKYEAEFQANMLILFIVIVSTSLISLIFALSFAHLINREVAHRLKDTLLRETQHLLEIQEYTSAQLQQANSTLQISEEKLTVTLNSIGDAVMATDATGHVTLLNPLAEKLTGWTQAEAAGHPVNEIFHIINEETRALSNDLVKETLTHGTTQTLTNHTILISRAGKERAIADCCAPIRNRTGQVVGAVLVFRDVTDKMEIEIGLEKTRKELAATKTSEDAAREYAESIINTVLEPLIALDQDLRVVSVSRSFYEVFKVNPEETVGQLIYDLGNKQWDIPKLRELLETILPQKSSFDNYEVEHNFATIGRRTMLLNARQIQRVLGKERIILLTIADISHRREIENGLEKTRKELESTKISEDAAREYAESIINTVRESLIALDQNLRVVSVSRSFYEVFKVNPNETVGQLIYDLGNKQWDIPKLRELLETILPQKSTFDNYEVEHNFATIGRRTMLLNARQIRRASGKERIILLAIEDITERREIETGLQKAHAELTELAAELKRTARVKSEFLANMSHELRTPLNSINGFSEVLFDETFGPLNEKQKKYVYNVLTSGKHLLLLINQILDMAKMEAGKMKLGLSNVPMKSLLHELSLLVADLVAKKKLRMVVEIADTLPDIEADELKVKEIVYNLLSNAVKFTPAGGEIGIRAHSTGTSIEVVVWDSGVGIAHENMEKVFEGFFRVDTPYSRVTEGTGLGLPLSRKLVELHGGELSITSKGLDQGTSVRFYLPIISRMAV